MADEITRTLADPQKASLANQNGVRWGKVIDNSLCIGCHACTVACKAEHEVPLGVTRTFVEYVEVGQYPSVRRNFQVTRCNQCAEPPCVFVCPVTAMFQRADGIVDFDREVCIGCKACIAACPYDAIYINPENHSAEKCNFCTHRIDAGLEPACVVVCPTEAIIVGDLNDATSEISSLLTEGKPRTRRPEKATNPKVFYIDAGDVTLDPTVALRRQTTATSQPPHAEHFASDGRADVPASSMAAALVAFGHAAPVPWDWRVSGYTWTKSIAAGVLMALVAAWVGGQEFGRAWHIWAAIVAGVFTALTGALLVADLTHPSRFLLVLIRPQWRSWLARGAYILTAYGIIVGAYGLAAALDSFDVLRILRWPTIVLTVPTAVYTAFILGQSKGRDLWQNDLLPMVFLGHASLAGVATLMLLEAPLELQASGTEVLLAGLLATAAVVAVFVLSEVVVAHPTRQSEIAARNLIRGRYAWLFWGAAALLVGAAVVAGLGLLASEAVAGYVAAILGLTGLFGYEHAYIQAGQSVPQA